MEGTIVVNRIKFVMLLVLTVVSPGLARGQSVNSEESAVNTSRVSQVIIDAIRAAKPSSAKELMRAVHNLVNIGEFDLASGYLDQALALKTTDAQFDRLVNELGSPFFFRLSLKQPLQPKIETYTRRVFAAAHRVAHDPARLSEWVAHLDSDSADKRQAALNELRSAGSHGAAAILTELANADSKLKPSYLTQSLIDFGPAAKPALIAVLRSGEGALPFYALKALRKSARPRSEALIPDLLKWCFANNVDSEMRGDCRANVTSLFGSLPSRDDACEYLVDQIDRLLAPSSHLLPADIDGASQLWFWEQQGKGGRLVHRSYPQAVAQLIRATQLATDLFAIDNQTGQPRRRFAATQLGTAKIAGGIPRPLSLDKPGVEYVRAHYSPEELETVLKFCLDRQLIPSAVATIELLAAAGDEGNLGYEATRGALSAALRYPNRRVQFAAAQTIMAIGPQGPFGGASDLVKVLARFASSDGRPRVLVVHPIRGEADLLANSFPSLGYSVDVTTNGPQALECLLQKSDYDVILLGDSVSSPKWSELLQQLQHLAPQIPLCVMTRDFNQSLALEVAQRYERVTAFPLPYDEPSIAAMMRVVSPTAIDHVAPSERRFYATEALGYLAQLAGPDYRGWFDLHAAEPVIVAALRDFELRKESIEAAGMLGTPALQVALVELAGDTSRTLAQREAAIEALDVAVAKRGLLLTHPQLRAQYQQYNQAVDVEAEDVDVLGKLLDSIERPSGETSRSTR